ncbi:MAG: hypothetical protein ACFB0B_20450 [Thermonemataceae bacterium]
MACKWKGWENKDSRSIDLRMMEKNGKMSSGLIDMIMADEATIPQK